MTVVAEDSELGITRISQGSMSQLLGVPTRLHSHATSTEHSFTKRGYMAKYQSGPYESVWTDQLRTRRRTGAATQTDSGQTRQRFVLTCVSQRRGCCRALAPAKRHEETRNRSGNTSLCFSWPSVAKTGFVDLFSTCPDIRRYLSSAFRPSISPRVR